MDNTNLNSFVERLVNLEREKKQLSEMISEVKTEAKNTGLDPDAVSLVVSRFMADESKVEKMKARMEAARLYAESIGQASLF